MQGVCSSSSEEGEESAALGVLGGPAPLRSEGSAAGLAERRASLKRRTSVNNESEFKDVICRLEKLGDSIDGKISDYINLAFQDVSCDDLTYSKYKSVASKLFSEVSCLFWSLKAVCKVFFYRTLVCTYHVSRGRVIFLSVLTAENAQSLLRVLVCVPS